MTAHNVLQRTHKLLLNVLKRNIMKTAEMHVQMNAFVVLVTRDAAKFAHSICVAIGQLLDKRSIAILASGCITHIDFFLTLMTPIQ